MACDRRRISVTGQRRFQVGKSTGSSTGSVVVPSLDQLLQVADAGDLREASFVDPRLKAILERDHQLDSLE